MRWQDLLPKDKVAETNAALVLKQLGVSKFSFKILADDTDSGKKTAELLQSNIEATFGRKVSETDPQFRRDVATVVDDLDFFPDLSVVEHLDLLARAHGYENPDPMVDEVLDEVQLVPQAGQLPGTLSSGQRRRLALATAFVRPRKLLIMDEPEQRLDTEGVAWLSKRLQAERKSGLAIVFASHEPSLVESVATRVVRLGAPA